MLKSPNKGFSIVELIVATVILLTVSGLILVSYGRSGSKLAFESEVEQLAVAMREAQSYALTIRTQPTLTNLFPGYGIYFSRLTPRNYVIYIDSNNNRHYDEGSGCGSATTECLEERDIEPRGGTIAALCGVSTAVSASTGECALLAGAPDDSVYFDINFTQKNTDPLISGDPSSLIQAKAYDDARVVLISPRGQKKVVSISSAGRVLVQ
jgi:type II secretory pathway pseudopilin PulG